MLLGIQILKEAGEAGVLRITRDVDDVRLREQNRDRTEMAIEVE